jgi:hypothetical protein
LGYFASPFVFITKPSSPINFFYPNVITIQSHYVVLLHFPQQFQQFAPNPQKKKLLNLLCRFFFIKQTMASNTASPVDIKLEVQQGSKTKREFYPVLDGVRTFLTLWYVHNFVKTNYNTISSIQSVCIYITLLIILFVQWFVIFLRTNQTLSMSTR